MRLFLLAVAGFWLFLAEAVLAAYLLVSASVWSFWGFLAAGVPLAWLQVWFAVHWLLRDDEPNPDPGEEAEAASAQPAEVWRDTTRTAQDRVSAYIRHRRRSGEPIERITRDSVGGACGLSAGAVSGTAAWKSLAAEKRQATAPANAEDAALRAARRGDWRAVESLQGREQRG